MRLYHGIVFALVFTKATAAPTMKWSTCPTLTTIDLDVENGVTDLAKCAIYTPPLCHPGICETPKTVNKTINVFVKSILATKVKPEEAPNVWLLQGGPMHNLGACAVDVPMFALSAKLNGKVNVYTMDYRGSGRGTQLGCQSISSFSGVDPLDVPGCAHELHDKFGDLAAFSPTSAAKDLVAFISDHTNGFSTTIYGMGYGTMWVQRVMQLDPPEVTGYVLDGIVTATPGKLPYVLSTTPYVGDIGDGFLSFCAQDSVCDARFKKKGLKATIQHLFTTFDNNPSSKCAKLLKTYKSGQDDDSPSLVLRYLLGSLLADSDLRTLVAPVTYRLLRCASKDVDVLTHFIDSLNVLEKGVVDGTSVVLNYLVEFSDMWDAPSASTSELKAQFEETTLSGWASYTEMPLYCAFSKEKSSVCNKLKLGSYVGNGILYERDEYANKAITIPGHASVLFLSSEMDPVAPHQYAEDLFDVLDGDEKQLVKFQYTTGGNLIGSGIYEELCGLIMLSSYVLSNGNLDKLDMSCLVNEKMLNLTVPIGYQYSLLSTDDAYDGEVDAELASRISE